MKINHFLKVQRYHAIYKLVIIIIICIIYFFIYSNTYNQTSRIYDRFYTENLPYKNRLIIIGDLHGDYNALLRILLKSKVINNELNWTGKNTTLVQSGDIVDRGEFVFDIYSLLWKLQQQAKLVGGEVIILLGNHELMNFNSNFEYVSPELIEKVGGIQAYQQIWSSNHLFGKKVRLHPALIIRHHTLIVHGGLLHHFVPRNGDIETKRYYL